MNPKGEMVIPPQFESTWRFSEGFAAVQVGDQWGYINRQRESMIAPQFSQAIEVSEGLASVEGGDNFSDGLAYALLRHQEGYINAEGNWAWSIDIK